jgi:hypothetical protein
MLGFFQCSPLITSDSDLLCCFSKMYYIYMSNTAKVLSEAGTGYPSRSAGLSHVFFWMCVGWEGEREREVAHHFSFLCCVVFVSFVWLRPVSCVPNIASVSGCPFLIASSFFSNVYLYIPLITSDGELCS